MTIYLLDVASYQGDLRPDDVKRAGFDAVNLKISHGNGGKSVHPRVAWWVTEARRLGLGISTFHYFVAGVPGAVQARHCLEQMAALDLQEGTAHQVDVESDPVPDLAAVREYIQYVAAILRRPIALYTGDWWWTARPGWSVSDLAPHLWAAPNAGYPGRYPGDQSPHWRAGYGGWDNLAIMQYAVEPLTFPDGSRGTIKVSKSAIRDPAVWRDLTTGGPRMTVSPESLRAVRTLYMDCLAKAGFVIDPRSVGISRSEPGTSYHIGKGYLTAGAYSVSESSRDRNGLSDASSAVDFGWFSFTWQGRTHNLRTFSAWLVQQCQAGTADSLDIREVIYSLDGKTVKRWDRLGIRSTGDSSHETHTHVSWFRDSEFHNRVAIIRRYFTEIGVLEGEVSEAEVTSALNKFFAGGEHTDGTPTSRIGRDAWAQGIPNPFRPGVPRTFAYSLLADVAAAIKANNEATAAVLANVQMDDGDKAAILARIEASTSVVAAASAEAVREAFGSDEAEAEDIAEALVAAMGRAKAEAVAAAITSGGPPE